MSRSPAKTLLGILAVLLVAGVVWRFYRTPERSARNDAVERRVVALRVLAEHLAAQTPGGNLLVIANPFAQLPGQTAEVYAFEAAALRGVKKGLGGKLRLVGVAHPKLTPTAAADPTSVPLPPDLTTPLSFMTERGAWDALRRDHPTANVWVSLIGLPLNAAAMEFWRESPPQLGLLLPDLRVLGDSSVVFDAFRSGKILAVVLNRPGVAAESAKTRGDYRAEFDRHFVLVTQTNLAAVLGTPAEGL